MPNLLTHPPLLPALGDEDALLTCRIQTRLEHVFVPGYIVVTLECYPFPVCVTQDEYNHLVADPPCASTPPGTSPPPPALGHFRRLYGPTSPSADAHLQTSATPGSASGSCSVWADQTLVNPNTQRQLFPEPNGATVGECSQHPSPASALAPAPALVPAAAHAFQRAEAPETSELDLFEQLWLEDYFNSLHRSRSPTHVGDFPDGDQPNDSDAEADKNEQ